MWKPHLSQINFPGFVLKVRYFNGVISKHASGVIGVDMFCANDSIEVRLHQRIQVTAFLYAV